MMRLGATHITFKMTTVHDESAVHVQVQSARNFVVIPCEHSIPMSTGSYRAALAFNLMPDVVALKKSFSEIIVTNVRAEVRQDSLLGTDSLDVTSSGRVFVAVIPSGKNTDAASGTNASTVMSVRRKRVFPLSSTIQESKEYKFNLTGFETDVAQDPRRQQGLVAWLGNTGITAAVKGETFVFVSVTWFFDCECTGIAAIW